MISKDHIKIAKKAKMLNDRNEVLMESYAGTTKKQLKSQIHLL